MFTCNRLKGLGALRVNHTDMDILITGGAGFIGSHLCARLIDRGNRVICLDNLVSGRRANIDPLLEHPAFRFLERDVIDPASFDDLGHVDRIFNLACPASPRFYQADPIATMKTSVLGALNALEFARKSDARILQTSTSEVYGDPLVHPQDERYRGNVNPVGIRACYDEGKRAAETLFFDYKREYGADIRVVRIFNTYGPHMQVADARVIPNFIAQALAGEDITVYGDGSQTRSFCYVDDLVDALLRMMDQDEISGPVNLGNPQEYTILQLAQDVIELTGSNSHIVFHDLPDDDPKRRRPDITLATKTLGWKPQVPLEEGLRRTIDAFRK